MDLLASLQGPFSGLGSQGFFLVSSTVILLIIIFFLYKTYRASLNVEAKLSEFASLTPSSFGRKLHLIEVNANEYRLNKQVLGPLARIIDEYCVMTTNEQGIITFANDRFLSLCGFSFRQLIGQHESLHHPKDLPDLSAHFMRCDQARHGVWSGEVCGRGHGGDLYWVNMFIFPLSYITDEDHGYIYFGTDITQIKAQNHELMQAVRDKDDKINQVESMLLHSEKMASLGTISAGIAHEINNPIAFVSANLRRSEQYLATLSKIITGLRQRINPQRFEQFLQAEQSLRLNVDSLEMILNDYPELMRETSEGIHRIKKIIRDLKHFSHDKKEHYEPVDMPRCVATSVNLARQELADIHVTSHVPPDLPTIYGSESQLSQVLMNLFVNAAQAVDENGEIRIDAHNDENWCYLLVSDNGIGMEEEQLQQIFEPFFTTKPLGKGTGLGLSISQDIIQRHGGTLTASSSPGQGTKVEIRLPLIKKQHAHAA